MVVEVSIFVTALAALITAIVNWQSVVRLSRGVESQLFTEFSRRYNSDEMRAAIIEILIFYSKGKDNFIERYINLRKESGDEWRKLDKSNRLIVRYFIDVKRLYEAGYISKKFAILLIDYPGVNVFYEIIAPIGKSLRPNSSASAAASIVLKRILNQHGDGLYLEGINPADNHPPLP